MKSAIIDLIDAGKYSQAAEMARKQAQSHPNDPEFRTLQALALLRLEKSGKALKILERAATQFPEDWQVLSLLGQCHSKTEDWVHAEDAYRRSISHSADAEPVDRALLHDSLGETLWAQTMREEALEEWHTALTIDPHCSTAREALEECTNVYGEPKAPTADFDDFYHFAGIQKKRYFNLAGYSKFKTIKEAEEVHKRLQAAWNASVVPRLSDAMSPGEKTKMFSSVTVDFFGKGSQDDGAGSGVAASDPRFAELLGEVDKVFPFLPSGGPLVVTFAAPAMNMAGLGVDRYRELVDGATPTDEEREILSWGYSLVSTILAALEAEAVSDEMDTMMDAVELASEYLDSREAARHVRTIREILAERIEEDFRLPVHGERQKRAAPAGATSGWFLAHSGLIGAIDGLAGGAPDESAAESPDEPALREQYTLALQLAEAVTSGAGTAEQRRRVESLSVAAKEDIIEWMMEFPLVLAKAGMSREAVHLQQVWAEITCRDHFLGCRLSILAEAGLRDEADVQREQLMREFPDDLWVQFKVGDSDRSFGRHESAERQYRKCLALAVDPEQTKFVADRLASLLGELGREKEANDLRKKML